VGVIAALIMASVFMAFIPTPDSTIKLFGISLASAVLIDAFIIRLIFVPSLMTIIGRPNWWLPRWLGKILPVVHVESESEDDEVDDVLPVKAGQ
jgi:RND superfamily putative drug exporter